MLELCHSGNPLQWMDLFWQNGHVWLVRFDFQHPDVLMGRYFLDGKPWEQSRPIKINCVVLPPTSDGMWTSPCIEWLDWKKGTDRGGWRGGAVGLQLRRPNIFFTSPEVGAGYTTIIYWSFLCLAGVMTKISHKLIFEVRLEEPQPKQANKTIRTSGKPQEFQQDLWCRSGKVSHIFRLSLGWRRNCGHNKSASACGKSWESLAYLVQHSTPPELPVFCSKQFCSPGRIE